MAVSLSKTLSAHTNHSPILGSVSTPPASPRLPPQPSIQRAISLTSSRESLSQARLHDRFAELRDAIYFSSVAPGFILSADEKFAYPNYQAGQPPEEPVEIEDITEYLSQGFDLWNEHFTRRLPVEEYPVVQVVRQRKNYKNRRVGLVHPDGRKVVYEIRGECIYAPGTNTFIGGVSWTTELGDYEDVVRQDREIALSGFETICNSVPHMVWTANNKSEIDYMSKSFYDFTGKTPAETLGGGWWSVVHPDDMANVQDEFEKGLLHGVDLVAQFRYRRHDGIYRWMSARARPVKDELGNVLKWYGTTTDVHDLVNANNEAKKLESENARLLNLEHAARESNRLKSQFLAHMSHELRTPIAGIIGMVGLLRDTKLSTDQDEFADCIKVSAGNLLTIVNDILDFSKVESGRLQIEQIPYVVFTVIEDMGRVWTHIAQQKGLVFTIISTVPKDLEIVGDPTRIGQILSNLCSNAIKFTTTPGSVTLSVDYVQHEDSSKLCVGVEDTGIGIAPDVLDKLFQPFGQGDTSTARLYGGTGLGLIISRNLAELMGGSLSLESTTGKGTKAILNLPATAIISDILIPPSPESDSPISPLSRKSKSVDFQSTKFSFPTSPVKDNAGPQAASLPKRMTVRRVQTSLTSVPQRKPSIFPMSPSPVDDGLDSTSASSESRKGVTVLIVEDNPINQRIAIKSAEKLGFNTKAASNGQEALDFLRVPNDVDVVLMDCQMPVMDGYEATRRIRNEEPYCSMQLPAKDEACWSFPYKKDKRMLRDIPVIALTASAIPGDREKCYIAGFDDYMTKPLDSKLLERKLVKWAFGRTRNMSL